MRSLAIKYVRMFSTKISAARVHCTALGKLNYENATIKLL